MLGTQMESELIAQPLLLRQNWVHYDERLREIFRGRKFEIVVFAARGSSDNAALFARYLIPIFLQIPVVLASPSVLTKYQKTVRYPRALVVGISQSGEAPDVNEVLQAAREDGLATLAITNTAGSKLANTSEQTLLLDVGKESAIAATKTYTASLLALYALVRALGGELECPNLPEDDWVNEARSVAERGVAIVDGAEHVFSLARGIRFCSAQESALKLMECALLPCLPYSLADFQHGPRALAHGNTCALLFGEAMGAPNIEGLRILPAPTRKGIPEPAQPIWDAFFAQMLALLCARARGLDPDCPEGLQKVTKTL